MKGMGIAGLVVVGFVLGSGAARTDFTFGPINDVRIYNRAVRL